nr:hypothetical protein [Tanacetum cinerariifolium]
MLHQALRLPKKLEQPLLLGGRESVPNYCGLAYMCSKRWDANREYVFPRGCENTGHTPYPNPETTGGTTLLSGVKPQILPGRRDMDLFNLIRAPNPTKMKTGSRPRGAYEVPLLTVTANRVIEIKDPAAATYSSGKTRKLRSRRCPPQNVTTMGGAPEAGPVERVAATDLPAVKEHRKRGHDRVNTNAPLKVLRRDHADPRPTESIRGGKSLDAIELGMGSTRLTPAPQGTPVDVSDPDPLSFADPQSRPSADVTQPPGEQQSFIAAGVDSLRAAIIGRRWMIGRGLRLAVMKCGVSIELRQAFADVVSAGITKGMSEGLKHGVEHGHTKLDLEAIETYDPEAEAKYVAAFHALKNLKYPLVDQLESLKDAPIDLIMASLHLQSDTGDDAPQWVRELRPVSSQLTIPVYPEVRDPMDPWDCKEEILLADAIAANVSRAEKKRKCHVGLAILLADAATQTETSDEASPQLLRSSSLPVRYG